MSDATHHFMTRIFNALSADNQTKTLSLGSDPDLEKVDDISRMLSNMNAPYADQRLSGAYDERVITGEWDEDGIAPNLEYRFAKQGFTLLYHCTSEDGSRARAQVPSHETKIVFCDPQVPERIFTLSAVDVRDDQPLLLDDFCLGVHNHAVEGYQPHVIYSLAKSQLSKAVNIGSFEAVFHVLASVEKSPVADEDVFFRQAMDILPANLLSIIGAHSNNTQPIEIGMPDRVDRIRWHVEPGSNGDGGALYIDHEEGTLQLVLDDKGEVVSFAERMKHRELIGDLPISLLKFKIKEDFLNEGTLVGEIENNSLTKQAKRNSTLKL